MKQILKYLLFLMIGIIIYILVNSKDNFSVGIVSYNVVWGEEGSAAEQQQFDTLPEAEHFYTENHLDHYTYPNMAIYRVNDDGTQEYIEPPRQPTPTAEEVESDSITITISIISGTFQLQVPTAFTLQQFQEMINLERQYPPNFDRYRLILNGTGGLVLDEVIVTLSEGIRNLRQHFVNYRGEYPSFHALHENSRTDRTGIISNVISIDNRIREINDCVTEIQNYVRNITVYLGDYTELYTQILGRNQSFRKYQRPENIRYRNHRYRDQPQYLLDYGVLEYNSGTESEIERFNRVFTIVNAKITRNMDRIKENKRTYNSNFITEYTLGQEYLDRIFQRFQNIDRLLRLLFNMLDGMFTLEPTLVDVLEYYQIEVNGLTLVLRLVCASEGIPPSTD